MPDIRHLVFTQASPLKMYEAITTQQGIASWWSVANNALPEEGSIYRIYFGDTYYKEIKVMELVPHRRVSWQVLDGHPEWIHTEISFDMQAGDKGAELRFHHSGWQDYTDMFAQCNHHWSMFLQNLRAYAETRQPFAMDEFFRKRTADIMP